LPERSAHPEQRRHNGVALSICSFVGDAEAALLHARQLVVRLHGLAARAART
jgi:hypothetical protein